MLATKSTQCYLIHVIKIKKKEMSISFDGHNPGAMWHFNCVWLQIEC